jgi:ankyrin repeat protein
LLLCCIELSPSFSLSFFAPKYSEGNDTKKMPVISVKRITMSGSQSADELVNELIEICHCDSLSDMSESQSADALVDELVKFCLSDSLSEDGLREIIERHGCLNIDDYDDYEFFLEACYNELVTEGILRYLLEYFPDAVSATDEDDGATPLHHLCLNKNATRGMVQLLIDAHPESLDREDNDGYTPLHKLCINKDIDDSTAVDILGLLLERCPEAVRRVENKYGAPPIHVACGVGSKSFEFCRMLIEAYPGSERIGDPLPCPPFHLVCRHNTVATAEYLYKLYPECINLTDIYGAYPIHYAIEGLAFRTDPATAIAMVQFLLASNPNVASQRRDDFMLLPLTWVFEKVDANDSSQPKLSAAKEILQMLYDVHPEAIEDEVSSDDLCDLPEEIRTFINAQLAYAHQAKDLQQMNTPDESGQLPLHRALRDNVTLGSITSSYSLQQQRIR